MAVYFEGHFVTIEPGVGDEGAVLQRAVDDDVAPGREQVGHAARVDDRNGRTRRILDVTEPNRSPPACASPVGLPTTCPTSETVPLCPSSSLGFTDGVPPPAIEV